jgi:glutamate 5-kinase
MDQRKQALKGVKRMVVKVGTSLLADPNSADPNSRISKRVAQVVEQVQKLRQGGKEVIIVTSGAIGMGMVRLLMDQYRRSFEAHGVPVGQVLLTRGDFENSQRYLNAGNTLSTLLAQGAVPVINENDTVAVDEIKFGDNDNLAAQVCKLAQAQLLVIMTDVEGLFDRDPRKHPSAQRVSLVPKVTAAVVASAGGVGSSVGTGGMVTKIQAASTVTGSGHWMAIVDGRSKDGLLALMAGKDIGTIFMPHKGVKLAKRKEARHGS